MASQEAIAVFQVKNYNSLSKLEGIWEGEKDGLVNDT